MAGMFSLLNYSKHSLESASQPGGQQCVSEDKRPSQTNSTIGLTSIGTRRSFCTNAPSHTKHGCDIPHGRYTHRPQIPAKFRNNRVHKLHPILRRSVCTLILSGVGLSVAIVCIVLDYFLSCYELFLVGYTSLGVSIASTVVGSLWLVKSKKKLERKKMTELKKEEATRKRNAQRLQMSPSQRDAVYSATRWPSNHIMCDDVRPQAADSKKVQIVITPPPGERKLSNSNQSNPDAQCDSNSLSEDDDKGLVEVTSLADVTRCDLATSDELDSKKSLETTNSDVTLDGEITTRI